MFVCIYLARMSKIWGKPHVGDQNRLGSYWKHVMVL